MAVDTALKRYSMITLAAPAPRMLNIPDGTISQPDRQILLRLFSGILASSPEEGGAAHKILKTSILALLLGRRRQGQRRWT